MTLDYEIKDPKERVEHVRQVLKHTTPTQSDLTYMADYILRTQERDQTKEEKTKGHPIITSNRNATIQKRESSMDQLLGMLGDDFYNITADRPGEHILDPKDAPKDDSPLVRQYLALIDDLTRQMNSAVGKRRYALKKQIIETHQQVKMLRQKDRPTGNRNPTQLKTVARLDLSDEQIMFDDAGLPFSDAPVNLFNPDHISYLLAYYSPLKQECWEDMESDVRWLLLDLENIATRALPPYLLDLITVKVDGMPSDGVSTHMLQHWSMCHTPQYWSSVWKNKVPKMITDQAKKDYICFYWRSTGYGHWQTCRKCGRTLPAHPVFFTTNGPDRFYSTCRDCRSTRKGA